MRKGVRQMKNRVTLRLIMAMAGTAICVSPCQAGFTLVFVVDDALAGAALGQARLAPMHKSLDRVTAFFQIALSDSAAILSVPLKFEVPGNPNAFADASGQLRFYTWSTVRDRVNNVAADGNEPVSETNVYDNLAPTQLSFRWATTDTTPRTTSLCGLKYAQAQQLQFNPTAPATDENRIRIHPETTFANGTQLKWQFFPGALRANHTRFGFVVAHEVCHLLGFQTVADAAIAPDYLTLMDAYRFGDAQLPANAATFLDGVRELRPAVEASLACQIGATLGNGAFPMSRGARTGGDSRQASHFRAANRLTPPDPVGIMDPSDGDQGPDSRLASATVADLTVLDRLGWVLEPTATPRQIAGAGVPQQVAPLALATVRTSRPRFEWTDNTPNSAYFALNVFLGDPVANPDIEPVTFYDIVGTSYTLPVGAELSPGTYTWELVGMPSELAVGYSSGDRTFTIPCPADFDGDGGLGIEDLLGYLEAYGNGDLAADIDDGTGSGAGDGGVGIDDLLYFLARFEGGC
jgi:hypothetical protein